MGGCQTVISQHHDIHSFIYFLNVWNGEGFSRKGLESGGIPPNNRFKGKYKWRVKGA